MLINPPVEVEASDYEWHTGGWASSDSFRNVREPPICTIGWAMKKYTKSVFKLAARVSLLPPFHVPTIN